jgi:hypothetical protein
MDINNLTLELRNLLAKRELEVLQSGSSNVHLFGLIENRKRDIEGFEISLSKIPNDPTLRHLIVSNFTKDAERIKAQIAEIVL